MELTEVLREIRPCNTENPYIFISYSSEDKDLVWRDVLEFQRRGYNIWIDEKNLDKTQDSWRYNALPAIEDMDCELVVFYVSRHSLISEGCYLELGKTIEAQTQAIHFGPVKFIAVDVEEIGNIMEFSKTVYNDLRSGDLPKEQKQQRAIILDKFKKDFFNSNNEKVRIHPKNEVNRKMDYYEEILASFPDSTRIFPEHREEEVSAEEEVPAETAEPEKEKAPEKAGIPAEKEAAEAAACPVQKGTAQEDPAARRRISEKEQTEESTHEEIIRHAVRVVNRHMYPYNVTSRFMKIEELSDVQLNNALKMTDAGAGTETLIGFCDTTGLRTGEEGFLLTTEKLYSEKLKKTGESLDFWKIRKVVYPGQNWYGGELIFEDNSSIWLDFGFWNDFIFSFLNIVTEIKEGVRKVDCCSIYSMTEERIKDAASGRNKAVRYRDQLSETQLKNAVNTYQYLESTDKIVCMWDPSADKDGRKGFTVTRNRLYCSGLSSGKYDYIELDNLKEAVSDGPNISITYNDGYGRKLFFDAYAPKVYAFLEKLITSGQE